jgi:hypothetical protein
MSPRRDLPANSAFRRSGIEVSYRNQPGYPEPLYVVPLDRRIVLCSPDDVLAILAHDEAQELVRVVQEATSRQHEGRTSDDRTEERANGPAVVANEAVQVEGNISNMAINGGVGVEISPDGVLFRGLDERDVLDGLAAWAREHYWDIRPIEGLHWEPVEWISDPNGEQDGDVAPVFVVKLRGAKGVAVGRARKGND